MRWIWIRHAESTANAEGWLAGHADVPLTVRGREQARALGPALAPHASATVWCSDLQRAVDTARLALPPGTPLCQSAALRERDVGGWERRDRSGLRASGEMRRLLTWTGRPPGGESLQDLALRVLPWCAARQAEGGPLVVVSHGGVLRTIVGLLDGLPLARIGRWDVPNTEVLVREADAADWERAMELSRRR